MQKEVEWNPLWKWISSRFQQGWGEAPISSSLAPSTMDNTGRVGDSAAEKTFSEKLPSAVKLSGQEKNPSAEDGIF